LTIAQNNKLKKTRKNRKRSLWSDSLLWKWKINAAWLLF